MAEAYDPESLYNSQSPSFATVETSEGIRKLFVANASMLENGWLSLFCWDGTLFKVPPGKVWNVERVETEYPSDELDSDKQIADETLREKAKELANGEMTVDL